MNTPSPLLGYSVYLRITEWLWFAFRRLGNNEWSGRIGACVPDHRNIVLFADTERRRGTVWLERFSLASAAPKNPLGSEGRGLSLSDSTAHTHTHTHTLSVLFVPIHRLLVSFISQHFLDPIIERVTLMSATTQRQNITWEFISLLSTILSMCPSFRNK